MKPFNQLWGTFSVRDHLKPGAFITEVLLYDRLVIPVPPKDEPQEWDRWNDNGWNPLRQQEVLACLTGIAEPIEWTAHWRSQWEQDWNKARQGVSRQVAHELAFYWTGSGLLKQVPAHAKGIVAASSYSSLDELQEALGVERTKPGVQLPPGIVSAVLGREFLVPEDPKVPELELLREAVALAKDPHFQRKRVAYHEWQQKFFNENGMTDFPSVKLAVEQMNDLLADERSMASKKKLWTGVRRAFFFAQVAVGVAFTPVLPLAIGNAAIAVGAFTATEMLSRMNKDQDISAAALLIDAQRKLDLTINK